MLSSAYLEKGHHRQKNKTHRGNDGMRCHIGTAAERNDHCKIKEHSIIKQEVFSIHKVVPCQEIQIADKNEKKYIQVEFVAFAPFIFGEHAHPNHHICNGSQDGKKYSEKAWIEE